MKNKKGDLASMIFIVVFLFLIGTIFLFITHLNNEIFTEINQSIIDVDLNTTYTTAVIDKTVTSNNSVWDYAFLGVFMGCLIAIGLSAYAIRISPVFYWIYGIMSLVVLAAGVMLSNVWQDLASDSAFTVTITRFPITNALLGTYYPLAVTAIIIIMIGILFGKPPQSQQQDYY